MQILFCLKSDDFELQPGIPLSKILPGFEQTVPISDIF